MSVLMSRISMFHGIGRRLLFWFSLFFLMPLLTASITGYQQSKKAIRRQVFDHFNSLLNLQRDALMNTLLHKEALLRATVAENEFLFISTVVLQSSTFTRADILTARKRLRNYLIAKNRDLGARALWITGRTGTVIAALDPGTIGSDRRNSPEVRAYHNDPAPVQSLYVETASAPEVLIFSPIKSGNGADLGLFTISLNMEDIYRVLENRTGLGKTGETYLINRKGIMISRSRFLRNAILKKKIDLANPVRMESRLSLENYPLNYLGVPVIQASVPFPYFGWTLIAEMNPSEAFHELIVQRNRTILMVSLLLILLVITAAFLSRNLTRPIRTLVQAARMVGQGDLQQKIEVTSNDELAELTTEFNRMAERLRISQKKMEAWNATIQQKVEQRTEELLKSELKFRNLMEKANDAILIFDAGNHRCTVANIKAEILTGYTQTELLGIRFVDLFFASDLQRIHKHYQEIFEKGSANLYNIPLKRKEGRVIFVDISNSQITFQKQTVVHCILHDVTEQRRMEREREAVFQISDIIAKSSDLHQILRMALDKILQNLESPVGLIFLFEPRTRELILACSRGVSTDYEEAHARQTVDPGATGICLKTARTREVQIADLSEEPSLLRRIGPEVDLANLQSIVSFPMIVEDTLAGVLIIITDRTRGFSGEDLILLKALTNQLSAGILRIQLEQKKHQDDQFLAGILTDSVDGIISMDADDHITSWNRGAENIFHLRKKEALGKPFRTLFQKPELLMQDQIHQRLKTEGAIRDYEITNVTQEGRAVTLRVSQTAIRDHNGKFIGNSAVIRDITEQKEIQKTIQQSEKLASIGQLAAGIAHEIGTPLNIISGNAEYLMMDMDPDEPKMEELSIIVNQTERITKLIQQLMDFARNREPRLERTNINQLIENTLTLTQHTLKKNSITPSCRLNDSIPEIIADPSQLQQVFLNMMINAIQAMPGGGKLTIETDCDGHGAIVRIRDTGHGIPPEVLQRIFDPFFTTKEVGQGTGLGLSVSHRIIENHKGRIEVESRVDRGSCFTVILPVEPGQTTDKTESI